MRVKHILALALGLFALNTLPGECGEKRFEMEKIKGKSVPGVESRGGEFRSVGGHAGWTSNISFGAVGDRKDPGNAFVNVDLAGEGRDVSELGTIEFWAYFDGSTTRSRADVLGTFYDNLAGFQADKKSVNADKKLANPQYLTISLYWLGRTENGRIALEFDGPSYNAAGWPVLGQIALFDNAVRTGQWVHVAVTWGAGGGKDNRAYLNGKPASGYYTRGLDGSYAAVPEPRDGNLGTHFRKAKGFMIGSEPLGNDLFRYGLIGEVALHDTIVTTFDLTKHKPVIRNLRDNVFRLPGISGKLVTGDVVEASFEAEPGGSASFEVIPGRAVPMAFDNATGLYKGSYALRPGDYLETGRIVGRFASVSGWDADPAAGEGTFSADARSRFAMTIDKTDLPADSTATARVKVKTTDANGNPVKDHQVKVTLSTTDEYTGLVGGGSARYRDAAAAAKDLLAGAEVETRWKGITDSWGEVEFDFTSGFAAKTIVLQAKDMTSGDVGVDYITSYKEASIDIVLTPPISRAAARRGLQYMIKVEATRTELTADGRSRSVIRATVSDPTGKPVAGDNVVFTLSSANGTLNMIKGITDAAGVATAEYIAGKKIGIVVVTAIDTVRNISGSVSITLLSDAPAKIILKARPETMPADGNSRADISVKVTDINDNPNKDTKVEFRLSRGSGKMDYPDRVTDRFGDTLNRFSAGTTPGIATILATVRSKVPTEAELAKARNVLFVPYSDAGEDIRISQWFKRKGDTAVKGEPIVEYTFGRGDAKYTLNAPYDCRIDFQFVEYWDNAKTGDTLAQITPVVIPGSTNPLPALPAMAPRRR